MTYKIEARIAKITKTFTLCECGGLLSYHHNWYDWAWYECDSCDKETCLEGEENESVGADLPERRRCRCVHGLEEGRRMPNESITRRSKFGPIASA